MAIITISRGTYTGGKKVAESLASKLGYPCLSREEIIREASIDFDIPEEELPNLAKQSMVLPDYKGNPRVITLEDAEELLRECFRR